MSKVRILSPRPENSTRRICGGFNFLFGTCGFKRQTVVCRGSNLSLGRDAPCVYPRSCSNFALLVFTYSDSPRLKYAAWAENAGFYIQKCTVCDFQNVKSAQFSDMTYTGKFCDADFELDFLRAYKIQLR